jgi:iron(III) transport system substrate-binding protein
MKKILLGVLLISLISFIGCENTAENNGDSNEQVKEVVVYTAVDQNYAEIVLEKFTKDTGIKVLPVFDVEASKTTGLINRLIAEKDNATADIFWNNEISQTLSLKEQGVLKSYESASASDIPDNYKDPEGYWTAFGGRARCFIINTDLVAKEDYPKSIMDLFSDKYPAESVAIARPLFGTTLTQASALFSYWGSEEATNFYERILDHGVTIVEGNSVVKDQVAQGNLMWGLTDTDDAIVAIEDGSPVEVLIPDQDEGGLGTLVIPNAVSMIEGSPNEEAAKAFIDWILLPEQEKYLIEIGWTQVAVRNVDADSLIPIDNLKTMPVTFSEIFEGLQEAEQTLRDLYLN